MNNQKSHFGVHVYSRKVPFLYQEAQELLGDAPIGETRSQTRDITKAAAEEEEEEDDEEDEEDEDDDGVEDGNGDGDEEVTSLKRTHTMAETVQVRSEANAAFEVGPIHDTLMSTLCKALYCLYRAQHIVSNIHWYYKCATQHSHGVAKCTTVA